MFERTWQVEKVEGLDKERKIQWL